MLKFANFVIDNAEKNPEKVREMLIDLHKKGETADDILGFARVLRGKRIKVFLPEEKIFDVCGTGGSGKNRINLSTVLAIRLSKKFTIAKHGNRAASGKVGSFDLIESVGYEIGDTPEKVKKQIEEKDLSFVFAPAFHPALRALAPIRKSIPHPTIFNYLGPLLNPVSPIIAQMIGVSSVKIGEKLAEVCKKLKKNALIVHDSVFGLDDVSLGGKTLFWETSAFTTKPIRSGSFVPEDFGFSRIFSFSEIQGGDLAENQKIFKELLNGTAPKPYLDFLKINQTVAENFFLRFYP